MLKAIIKIYENKTVYTNAEIQLHRLDGPAIEYNDGHKEWWKNGFLHREDGPAIEYANGDKMWCQNGRRHRSDGPAFELATGKKEYFLEGKSVTKEKFEARNAPSCNGKIVEIDGKKYELKEVL